MIPFSTYDWITFWGAVKTALKDSSLDSSLLTDFSTLCKSANVKLKGHRSPCDIAYEVSTFDGKPGVSLKDIAEAQYWLAD